MFDVKTEIIDFLRQAHLAKVVRTEETVEEVLGAEGNENDIGTLADGTRYVKSKVIEYLTVNNYPMNSEALELAARKFPLGTTQRTVVVKEEDHLDHCSLEELKLKLQLELLRALTMPEAEKKIEYIYKVISIPGNKKLTDTIGVENIIMVMAKDGWRLHSCFSNNTEVINGLHQVSVNSVFSGGMILSGETVCVFERPTNK